jgi:hypothetical protein
MMKVEGVNADEVVAMSIEDFLMNTTHQGTAIPLFKFLGGYPTSNNPHTDLYSPINNSNAKRRAEAAVRWIRNAAHEISRGVQNEQDRQRTFTDTTLKELQA